jgi:hypothetical protein
MNVAMSATVRIPKQLPGYMMSRMNVHTQITTSAPNAKLWMIRAIVVMSFMSFDMLSP